MGLGLENHETVKYVGCRFSAMYSTIIRSFFFFLQFYVIQNTKIMLYNVFGNRVATTQLKAQ